MAVLSTLLALRAFDSWKRLRIAAISNSEGIGGTQPQAQRDTWGVTAVAVGSVEKREGRDTAGVLSLLSAVGAQNCQVSLVAIEGDAMDVLSLGTAVGSRNCPVS